MCIYVDKLGLCSEVHSHAPEWYHERRAVTHVSQDPSPGPHCVSFFHSRPSPCSEFLKKVYSFFLIQECLLRSNLSKRSKQH